MSQPTTRTATMYAVVDTVTGSLVTKPVESREEAERAHEFYGWINDRAKQCAIGTLAVTYEIPALASED